VQQGHLIGKEKIGHGVLLGRIREGNPHAVLTLGLFVLTLVRSRASPSASSSLSASAITLMLHSPAYVLAGLIVGVLVGSVVRDLLVFVCGRRIARWKIKGKAGVITGGSSGIGRATAERLAKEARRS